jgi:hypothetical protein
LLIKRFPGHPFLFGVYPILALYALNIDQVQAAVIWRSLLVSLLAVSILQLILWGLIKDFHRAALLNTLSLILFFSYGHVYSLLKPVALGRHRFLLPLWLLIFLILAWWILKRMRNPQKVSLLLNGIGLAALAFPLIQSSAYSLQVRGDPSIPTLDLQTYVASTQAPTPDIYHILLDEYTRADVLQQVYALDNSAFLAELSRLGFMIPECSQSNYAQTEFVLASMLNLNYLDDIQTSIPERKLNRPLIRRMIMGNAVVQALNEAGYQIVAFETGYPFSEFLNADHYFSSDENEINLLSGLNNYEVLLIRSTAGLALLDASRVLPTLLIPQVDHPLEQKRERIRYDLQMLETIPVQIPTPKFVFVHIPLPHEPFVFGPQGESVKYPDALDEATYIQAYRDQVLFLNQRLIPILTAILASSEQPPIIILQGDTGPGRVSKERRMAILNALYLPSSDATGALPASFDKVPATLSPVNTYRLIFDLYFGSSLPYLDDISFYSTYTDPFSFEVIPNQSESCGVGE